LGVYPDITGLKIGNTQSAGKTTIVTSKREGKNLIALVLGADSILDRDLSAAKLLDIGYENLLSLVPVGVTEDMLKVKYSKWKFFD
jgi:D-alanyl-D-alanine carboxypeptidase